MSPIIKASGLPSDVQHVAFNLDDMAELADARLDLVRAEALKIVDQARRDADAIRAAAEKEGHRAADERTAQMLNQKLATLMPALEQAIGDVALSRQAWLAHWEQAAVSVSLAISAHVIRRELRQDPQISLSLVKEALELASGSSEIRVRLNPTDYETLGSEVKMLTEKISHLASAEIVADSSVSPGGCQIETRHGVIDQQIESQLARIEEELSGD